MKTNDCRDVQTKNNEREFGFFTPFFDDFFGVPSYDKKDVSIDVENGYLTIKASKNEETNEKDKKGNYVRRERKFGSASRSFYVGNVDENEVNAKLENGVLNIFVPKHTSKQSRIEIK